MKEAYKPQTEMFNVITEVIHDAMGTNLPCKVILMDCAFAIGGLIGSIEENSGDAEVMDDATKAMCDGYRSFLDTVGKGKV